MNLGAAYKFLLGVLLLVFVLASVLPVIPQSGSVSTGSPVVITPGGLPVANANVAICTANPGTTTPPCNTLATTYTDITLATPCSGTPGSVPLNNSANPGVGAGCSNPGLSDSFGNVVAYASAGSYWCQYYSTKIRTTVLPCIFPASINNILGTTNTWTGNNSFASVNNIRMIDGQKYTLNAAGINAADSDLGAGSGEIWVTSPTTATDAQISISSGHVLKVFRSLTIANPILLGNYSRLTCSTNGIPASGQIIASQNMSQMVRGVTQDNTTETWYIDNCDFNGGGFSFTKGVIDLTGMNDRGLVAYLIIFNYASAVGGIYGSNSGGPNHLEIKDVWLNASSKPSTSCMLLDGSQSSTNFVEEITLDDIECQNATSAYPIEFRNTNAAVSPVLRGLWAHHITIEGSSGATSGLYLNGLNSSHVEDVFCDGTLPNCVDVANNGNNYGLSLDGISAPIAGGTNTLIDRLNSITISQSASPRVEHYTVFSSAAGPNWSQALFNALRLGPATSVASLPTCNSSTQDQWRVVTDANSPSYNATLTGGGAVRIPVYCNGSNWTAH